MDPEDEELVEEDYENMTEEELRQKLPPYWFF